MTTGTAYYDLSTSPPTYNAMDFLLAAELWRLEQGLDRLDVRVLPGPVEGFRDDPLPPYGGDERLRWLKNIVLPMAALLPSCGQPARLVGRDDRTDGPEFGRGDRKIGFRWNTMAARAGLQPFRAEPNVVVAYRGRFGGERYVTITLRDTGWWVDRTSNLPAWRVVARSLEERGFRVVFVPDGTRPDTAVGGYARDPAAARYVDYRAALYAGATLNLGIGCGPMWFAWFMGVPVLMFVKLNENEPSAGVDAFRAGGLEPGEQLPNARPGQRLVWAADDAETILAAIEAHHLEVAA